MARQDLITPAPSAALLRAAQPELGQLLASLFIRYPEMEWATFARFGWRETPSGLVLTLAGLDLPQPGDLDRAAAHVVIQEPYSLRTALEAERHPLAVGVIHSHPRGYRTDPSSLDDDMDAYYADFFSGFAPDRPYVSLIFAERDGQLSGTGRVFWRGQWQAVQRFSVEGRSVTIGGYCPPTVLSETQRARLARLESSFGRDAAERLAASSVAVVGVSGTGSPAVEVLARAGVGRIILVDPDSFDDSNLERMHGSEVADIEAGILKVELGRRHIHSINPECQVIAIQGAAPQPEVVDALCTADVVLGCTDQHHSRLALSDLAVRYLLPTIDCGVNLEGKDGNVSGQVLQLVRFLAADPCALCREMIVQWVLDQELMTPAQRTQAQQAAQAAAARGDEPNRYWRNLPQLNTVGYLTTTAGAMAAGYAIGWVTGRFQPPFTRLQMNLSAPYFDVTDGDVPARPTCVCRRVRGYADQGGVDALIHAPGHWPPARLV